MPAGRTYFPGWPKWSMPVDRHMPGRCDGDVAFKAFQVEHRVISSTTSTGLLQSPSSTATIGYLIGKVAGDQEARVVMTLDSFQETASTFMLY